MATLGNQNDKIKECNAAREKFYFVFSKKEYSNNWENSGSFSNTVWSRLHWEGETLFTIYRVTYLRKEIEIAVY